MEGNQKKTVTLVELILAITLLAVIVLGASALEIAARRFLRSSERRAQVLNEAIYVLNHIAKSALMGIGNETVVALNTGNTLYNEQMLFIRQDSNGNFTVDSTDTVIGYAQQSNTVGGGNDTIIFICPDTGSFNDCTGVEVVNREQLTNRARLRSEGGGFFFTIANNTANISVVLRYNPFNPVIDPRDNPQIELNTTIIVPSAPL